jgi:hypothetical protein
VSLWGLLHMSFDCRIPNELSSVICLVSSKNSGDRTLYRISTAMKHLRSIIKLHDCLHLEWMCAQGWGLAGQWWSTQHHIYDPPSYSSWTSKPFCWAWFGVPTLAARNMVSYNTFNVSVLDGYLNTNIVTHILLAGPFIMFNDARCSPCCILLSKSQNNSYL